MACVAKNMQVLAKSEDERFWKYDHWIGSGSFKEVYQGWDNDGKQNVAWCEIKINDVGSSSKEKIMKEISVLNSINHPHVLQPFSYWEVTKPRAIILTTELMTGGTLKDYGKCSPHVIRNWGRQILQGLDGLHSHKPTAIIHRDLKCKNIFVDKASGIVKIGDLGLATMRSTVSQTKTNSIGSILYQAPDLADGHYNELVDVYSFGLCLLELSTGEYPYQECCDNMMQLLRVKDRGTAPKILESIADNILKNIITCCIKRDPNKRYCVTELLSHEFFAEKEFQVIVQKVERQAIVGSSKTTALMIQDTRENTVFPTMAYDFSCDTPQSVTQKLIDSGRIAEADSPAVTDALIEKVEVLSLLSQTNVGVGEVVEQTDSGVGTSTTLSITTTSFKEEEEIVGNGQIQLDDGAMLNGRQTPTPSDHEDQPSPSMGSLTTSGDDGDEDCIPKPKPRYSVGDELVTLKTAEMSIKDLPSASSEVFSDVEYQCWKANISKMSPRIKSNLSQAAVALYAKGQITYDLYNNIVSPQPGLSESEQINHLFDIIQRKLQNSDMEIVTTTWKAFTIAVVKIDSRYRKIISELELSITDNMSESEAFKCYRSRLCLLLQSSVFRLTDHLWSDMAITDDEKSQIIDSNYHYEHKWMNKMIEEIGEQIKQDPAVFKEVVATFKTVEGLKKATEKYLQL